MTDQAIVDAILSHSPRSVLDIGCGEGWLGRRLQATGIDVIGVDIVPELIERASSAGGGDFRLASYEDIAAGSLAISVDTVVCNFSLLGKESVDGIFAAVPKILNRNGSLVIQTVHPMTACGDLPYRDGWRLGSWDGFNGDFVDPAPWYFRTLESWEKLFSMSGLELHDTRTPAHPVTLLPASVIFIGKAASGGR